MSVVDESRVQQAVERLSSLVGNLRGKSFLDIGCGSGIHSLAAVRLGATRVLSFDYDLKSVECSKEMKHRFAPGANWDIQQGSIIDPDYLRGLAAFDVVYSWGVLHHTGSMWQSFERIANVAQDTLAISIYADQGIISHIWKYLKKVYVRYPFTQGPIKLASLFTLWGPKLLVHPHRVISDWRNYFKKRGMSAWHDIVDWAGGYPYEFAKPEDIVNFFEKRGFRSDVVIKPRGSIRCNEFVFRKPVAPYIKK